MNKTIDTPASSVIEAFEPKLPTWFSFDSVERILMIQLATADLGLKSWCERHQICLRTVQRAKKSGRVKWDTADALACALGLHPAAIWPDWAGVDQGACVVGSEETRVAS